MISLPDFEIGEILYHGSKSLVCRALRQSDQQPVVLKILRSNPDNALLVEQFKREYQIAYQLAHPGVAQVIELQQTALHWVLIMVDSGAVALDRQLADGGFAKRPAAWFAIAGQAIQALACIHAQGIIHKDINPSNLIWNAQLEQLQIIDFGISSELQQETPVLQSPHLLEGTLAYLSPEQSGRMNRSVDYRADYYSLGITLYELWCGEQPFRCQDPVEMVHCHMARPATFDHPAFAHAPLKLKALLSKLMAKNPEERYQHHDSLQHDLTQCFAILHGELPDTPLLHKEAQANLRLPQKLYGRHKETAALLAAFDRVSMGIPEWVLIGGHSGTGKSVLVHEVHRPMTARHGYYAAGKCDQYKRNQPYAALVMALSDLMRQLLTEPVEQVTYWRQILQESLGENAAALTKLIPELTLLIGDTPDISPLPPIEAQNRLHRLIQLLIAALATTKHPLVLFLDDLQWADTPTLQLIEKLLTTPHSMAVLIISAYRDNETGHNHPLNQLRRQLQQNQVRITAIELLPLTTDDNCELIADALGMSKEECQPLAELCHHKTAGNPFFLSQFLLAIHERKLLCYDYTQQRWQWQLKALRDTEFSDNVIDLMIDKLKSLPLLTQTLLQLAASLGNRFALETLAAVSNLSSHAIHMGLWPAMQLDLLRPLDSNYKYLSDDVPVSLSYRFLHDRVQQAAYALSTEQEQQLQHLHIGRCLLAAYGQQDDMLFAITEHLNAARDLITSPPERLQLAELNFRAGTRAQSSSAHLAASHHMQTAETLLPDNCPKPLRRSIMLGRAETDYLSGRFIDAESYYPLALQLSTTPLEQADCFILQSSQYLLQGRNHEAIAIQRQGLQLLGLDIPEDEQALETLISERFCTLASSLGDKDEHWILQQPEMQRPEDILKMQLLHAMCQATYLSGQLKPYKAAALVMVETTLNHGQGDISPLGYVLYAFLLGALFGQFREGDKVGRMAVALADTRNNPIIRGNTHFLYAVFTSHWNRHLRHSVQHYQDALRWCLDGGDLVASGYLLAVRASDEMILGRYLPDIASQCEEDILFLRHTGQHDMADAVRWGSLQAARNLMGETRSAHSYSSAQHDEAEFLQQYREHPLHLAYYYHGKIRNAYLLDDPGALQLCQHLPLIAMSIAGQCKVATAYVFAGLSIGRTLRRDPAHPDVPTLLEQLKDITGQVKCWAQFSPENHGCHHALLQAELARLEQAPMQAMSFYKEAQELACTHGFTQLQALCYELTGEYWRDQEYQDLAHFYLERARNAYRAWGADAKVKQLENANPFLKQPALPDPAVTTTALYSNTTLFSLDLSSILKASLALSSELSMQRVLSTLLNIVLENAGAQSVKLLLQQDARWELVARGQGSQIDLLADIVFLDGATHDELPLSLLRYVVRTADVVVENCLADSPRFAQDSYCLQRHPQSVLAMPILRSGQVIGLLYLENNLMHGAFSHQRVEFLRVLAMQALIAIDNARLYDNLEQQVNERTAHLESIRKEQQAILDNALVGIALVRERRIIRCNPGFELMFGYEHHSLLGQATRIFYQDEEGYRQGEHYLSPEHDGLPVDRRLRHRDGHLLWCATQIKYLDASNPEAGMIVVCMDITARKEAERGMEIARIRAEDATQTKSLFLANMSHEIRTPMNAILGMAQLALQSQPNPRQANYLGKILHAGESLQNLLNDLLDFSKIEAGKLDLECTSFPLETLIEQTKDLLVLRLGSKPVTPLLQIDPDLPLAVSGDRLRIEQILTNLVSNAAKFTEKGHVTLAVSQLSRDHDNVTLGFSIHDSGIGIHPDQQKLLFQPFNQADNSITRRFGGTGLGLAICKQLVELMRGEIGLDSTPGVGSHFWLRLTLPVTAESDHHARHEAPAHLLLISHRDGVRRNLAQVISRLGHSCVEVSSTPEALICMQSTGNPSFDAIILDNELPGNHGLTSLQLLREQACHLPALLLHPPLADSPENALLAPLAPCLLTDTPVQSLSLRRHIEHLLSGHHHMATSTTTQHVAGKTGLSSHYRLLLVDDNDINREVVLGMLEDTGMQIDTAENGEEAIQAAISHPYDLILMDVQMPVMDGMEATRRIRQHNGLQALPIIALTAHAMESDRLASLACGMNDHLNKPVSLQALHAILAKWLPDTPLQPERAVQMRPQADSTPLLAESQYQKLLRHFHHQYHDLPKQLDEMKYKQNIDKISFEMHNLKSAAAYIGDNELASQASQVESLLRTGQTALALSQLGGLQVRLSEAIGMAYQQTLMAKTTTVQQHEAPQLRHDIVRKMAQLLAMLEQADSRAVSCIQQLQEILPIKWHESCQKIEWLLDEIEYGQALQQATAMAELIAQESDPNHEFTTQDTDH